MLKSKLSLLFPIGGDVGISIKANGVDYTYNYDPAGAWKATNYFALTGTATWTAANARLPGRSRCSRHGRLSAKTVKAPSDGPGWQPGWGDHPPCRGMHRSQ